MSFDVPRIAGSQTVYNALQNAASEHTAMAAAVGEQCSKDLEPLLDGVREWRGVISVLPDLLGLQKACIEAVRLQSVQCTSIHLHIQYCKLTCPPQYVCFRVYFTNTVPLARVFQPQGV